MAFFTINHVSLQGITAAVPANTVSNHDLANYDPAQKIKLISTLGIETRRVALPEQCASDLCMAAANKLIEGLNWDRSEIEVLFFVTQTPDYILPGTSLLLQERLGLPKSCITFDLNQGCAGYVYGLSIISAFLSSSRIKKGLLLVGDTITKLISPWDQSLGPIFADCGTATALVFNEKAPPLLFNISSEGADHKAIMVPAGGSRNPVNNSSLEYQVFESNIKRRGVDMLMKGLDVFNFSLKKVCPNVEDLMKKTNQNSNTIDYFVFHQANRLILEAISKKLNLPAEKVPNSLTHFGNTSGCTIPLTILNALRKDNKVPDSKMLLSGFGVGLSLASAIVEFKDVFCAPIIDCDV